MKPKISILIPCYNVEKYVRQCLDSVIHQTLKNIEIICINDGSKDGTLSTLKEYAQKDKRIQIIDKANSGYGNSMNQGLKKATGDYIGIVESDDFADLNMFEKLYKIAIKKNVDVVKSNFWEYFSKNNVNIKSSIIPQQDAHKVLCPRKHQGIFFSQPCIWSAIYKRDFLIKNHINFLETPGASYQDTAFNFKVWLMSEKVYFLNDAFLHYRRDNENSSVNSPGKVFCVCDEYHEIEKYAKKSPYYPQVKYLIPRIKYGCYMWNFERLTFLLKWKFFKAFSAEYKRDFEKKLIRPDLLGKVLTRRLRKIAYHPRLYFVSYYFKKVKKFILERK